MVLHLSLGFLSRSQCTAWGVKHRGEKKERKFSLLLVDHIYFMFNLGKGDFPSGRHTIFFSLSFSSLPFFRLMSCILGAHSFANS